MKSKEKELLREMVDVYSELTEEEKELSKELTAIMQETADDFAAENDINNLLALDDDLLDDLFMNFSLLTILEIGRIKDEEGEEILTDEELRELNDKELLENAHLKLINCCFRLAKVINPLGGFGADRLKLGLLMQERYEESFSPLVTMITSENVESFRSLLGVRYYDELKAAKVRAIGVVRTKGERRCPAGVAVYRLESAPVINAPTITVEYIYVAEQFRSFGVGNLLMANVARMALDVDNAVIVTRIRPRPAPEDSDGTSKSEIEFELLQDFFDSWRFGFSMDFSTDFYISLSDINFGKAPDGKKNDKVRSLETLGDQGPDYLRRFFKALNDTSNSEVAKLPYSYFDPKTSCVVIKDDSIEGVMLVHRYEDGDYRLEYLRHPGKDSAKEILLMLLNGYNEAVKNGDEDSMVTCPITKRKSWDMVASFAPDAKVMLEFVGTLAAPSVVDEISSKDWETLRIEAGYKPKVLEESDENGDPSMFEDDEAWRELDELLSMAGR